MLEVVESVAIAMQPQNKKAATKMVGLSSVVAMVITQAVGMSLKLLQNPAVLVADLADLALAGIVVIATGKRAPLEILAAQVLQKAHKINLIKNKNL